MFRIAMAQMNAAVGDLNGNVQRITSWLREAKKANADLIAFPELAITGYAPEDLLLKPHFVRDNQRALREVIRACRGVAVVVGYVAQDEERGRSASRQVASSYNECNLYNAAALVADGRLVGSHRKWRLSNHGVTDESRYFQNGRRLPVIAMKGATIGVMIGEEIGDSEGPIYVQASAGVEVIVNICAAPFYVGKRRVREQMLATRAREHGVIVTSVNAVGGQDELVFDGNSVILDQSGNVVARGGAFREELLVADVCLDQPAQRSLSRARKTSLRFKDTVIVDRVVINLPTGKRKRARAVPCLAKPLAEMEEVYQALVLAVLDYVGKNGFKRVMLGLSGGVDSALTAAIAVDALGPEHVLGVFMPSPYTSRESEEDASALARQLAIEFKVIPIAAAFETYRQSLATSFVGRPADITEENLQARIRGNILMALSNKFGYLVLTTGNKSELSVGYATLYGDMAGGFSVIKDVPKTMVYGLAQFRNGVGPSPVIPQRTLDRPPSAELRPNQKDEDSLPPYSLLDPILQAYVEENRSLDEIVQAGFDRATVARVVRMVDGSEFKRHQAPIGPKITHRALGKDRRMPITHGYRDKQ